jgi:hypothetical protein
MYGIRLGSNKGGACEGGGSEWEGIVGVSQDPGASAESVPRVVLGDKGEGRLSRHSTKVT